MLIFKLIFFLLFIYKDCFYEKGCHFTGLSCRYLDHLNSSILKEYYPDAESAIQSVRDGNTWGAIYFTENFTDSLLARMALGINTFYLSKFSI